MSYSRPRIEGYFRNIFGLLCPVLMTLGLVFAVIIFFEHRQAVEIQNKLSLWGEKAQITLASVRSNHTFADLITESGNKLGNEIEQNYSESINGARFVELLHQHFDSRFLNQHTQTWFFTINNGKITPQTTKGLANSRVRVMQKLLEGLYEFANIEDLSVSRINSLEKFIKGVFGPYSAPLSIGRRREGRLTPVIFDGKPTYVYWRQFKKNEAPFAVAITLFPAEYVENSASVLQFVADRVLKETRHHMAVAFIPVNHLKSAFSPIFPQQISHNPQYNEQILQLIDKLKKNSDDSGNKVYESGGHLFIRGFINADLPYDAVVFAPTPPAMGKSNPVLIPVTVSVITLWSLIYLCFYLINGRFGLPLALSFRILFFFSGLLPIFLMLSLGFSLIEDSYNTALFELRQENSSKLSSVNDKSDSLLPLFGQHISKSLKLPGMHTLLTSGVSEDLQTAFNKIKKNMQNIELTLDYMFVFVPGKSTELFLHDQRARQNIKVSMNLFAPAVYEMNKAFGKLTPLPEIYLDPVQKNFYKLLSSLANHFLEKVFLISYEKESFVKFGETSRDYFFTVILSKGGKIVSYVMFAANSERLFRSFFARELDTMNVSDAHIFLAAEELSNSDFTIFPSKKLRVLNSQFGQNAINFLKKCRSSIFEKYITDRDHLYLFFPMSKMQHYSGGCIVSLAEINKERDMKRLILVIIAVVLACIMYVIASFATAHMLMPLHQINSTLHLISLGKLDTDVDVNRSDELGQLGSTINLMLTGFKERLRLGKFVSTTLDKSLSQALSLDDLKKARVIAGTVLFSDIRNFTTLSESYPPDEIAAMLNTHLEAMSEEIQNMGGQVEQFIGDAIVAFFPDKLPEDSKSSAIKAAIAVNTAHTAINRQREINGNFQYAIGIGLQHGQLIAGSLITPARAEFSIIGDVRNEAEHFEAISKLGSYSRIIVSKGFIATLNDEKLAGYVPLQNTEAFELVLERPAK